MANTKVSELISDSMSKIQQMVNVNTVVGEPITTADGVTIIPVSKVKIGVGGGGSDLSGSKKAEKDNPFGLGGSGMGCSMSIDPVAFIVITDGKVRMMPVATPANSTVDRVVEVAPEMLDKVADFLDSRKASEEA